jgi:Uma2 family endonuclease
VRNQECSLESGMSVVVIEGRAVIPDGIRDHKSYRRWARSPQFPDTGRFAFLAGKIWVDMSPEELMTHNLVKGEYAAVLHALVKQSRLGRFFHDRTLVTNESARLTTEPDGTFVSFESLRMRRVTFVKGQNGYIEIQGTPDMTLEVVSMSSMKKDTIELRELYWKAGVREYWLVNALGDDFRFDILRRTRSGYVAAQKRSGWAESKVFGCSFKITSKPDELGYPEYTLHIR